MTVSPIIRVLQVSLLLSSVGFQQIASAQGSPTPPCPAPSQTSNKAIKPCTSPVPAAKKPSVAEQFPFPSESAKPDNSPDSPSPSTSPSFPPSSTPSSTPTGAAAQHPFPTTAPPKLPGDDSSSSSSSSASDPDNPPDIGPPLKDEGTEGTSTRRKLPKVKKVQSDDERVDEDLTVAKFYMRDENYPGAYLRAKDAIKIEPDYSVAHFALAEIAEKMKKKDEAVAEFQTYLKLDPDGEKAKEAKRALANLH
jgi:hypothetical protein